MTDVLTGGQHNLEIFSNMDKITTLVDLSLQSLFIKQILVEEPECLYDLRPEIHFLLIAQAGSAKSTLLKEISNLWNNNKPNIWTDLSNAGLMGTISKDGDVIPGAAWDSHMKALLVDEFALASKHDRIDAMSGLLQILEGGTCTRNMGFGIKRPFVDKKGKYFFMVDNGRVAVKTKVAGIVATMRDLWKFTNPAMEALVSRCIPFCWDVTGDELWKIAKGKKLLKQISIPKKTDMKEVRIPLADYEKIMIFVAEQNMPETMLLRTIGDCCRIYAIKGKIDIELFRLVCDVRKDFLTRRNNHFATRASNASQQRWGNSTGY